MNTNHALAGELVVPADVLMMTPNEISDATKSRFDGEGGFVLTRPNVRVRSIHLDDASAEIFGMFRTASSIVDVVVAYAERHALEPRDVLPDATELVRSLFESRMLVAADAPDVGGILATHAVGDVVHGTRIVESIQIAEDGEVYRGRRGDQTVVLKCARGRGLAIAARERAVLEHLDGRVAPHLLATPENALVLQHVAGHDALTVARRLRRARRAGARNGLLRMCVRIATAYAELHEAGVLHGDVHPKNVLVSSSAVHLVDFGYARIAGVVEPPRAGVPFFFEPEYAAAATKNERLPSTSVRSEIYALAGMCFLLLTGRHYLDFDLDKDVMFEQIAQDAPRSVGDANIDRVLHRALSKDPASRYATMRAFASALDALIVPEGRAVEVDTTAASEASPLESLATMAPPAATPRASVNFGAAGTALALRRASEVAEDPSLLTAADLWSAHAADTTGDDAWFAPAWGIEREAIGRGSLLNGPSGEAVARFLVAHARWDVPAMNAAVRDFVDAGERETPHVDLALGTAGTLLGAALIEGAIQRDPLVDTTAMRSLATRIAADLMARLEARSISGDCGVAHGVGGVVFALMSWVEAMHSIPPRGLVEHVAALADGVQRGARLGRRGFAQSWCNGAAGLVSVFLLAHRVFRVPRFFDVAAQLADHAMASKTRSGSLCCGWAGIGYAQLAMYRETDAPRYLERAREAATRARNGRFPSAHDHSLYKGALGAQLLGMDVEAPETSRFPLFEL